MKRNKTKTIKYRNIDISQKNNQLKKEKVKNSIYRFDAIFNEMIFTNNDNINNINRLLNSDTLAKSIQQSIKKVIFPFTYNYY